MVHQDRFTVSRISDNSHRRSKMEVAITVNGISERNASTLPQLSDFDRKMSLNQLTREALPRLDHFRSSKRAKKRPSLGELHGDPQRTNDDQSPDQINRNEPHFKLGWIQGVLIPVLLNIYGVMLFLRMGWIVGQSGIIESLIIISLSTFICIVTTLSLSAISTNGEVLGGGIYFIISRSLGPELGASVGVVFAFANAVSASLNTIGFCDSLNHLLESNGLKIIDNAANDTRIIGSVAILIMITICAVGMEWEVKAQNILVIIIVSAVIDFMVGTVMGPTGSQEIAQGFAGFSTEVFKENLYSNYRFSEGINQDVFSVFAIFFPSVTGIQAGANICGDLKNPGKSIPKGTMTALLIAMGTYAIFVLFVGGAAIRDASGNIADVVNKSLPYNFACTSNLTCEYGMENDYQLMQVMSVWSWLIYAGCFSATLSTALTNLLSVPRLIQALGYDKIFPGVIFFSKGYGKNGEPYRGYVLTLTVSVTFLLLADLNIIAPLITNFYLAAYALINFCCFHAAFVKPLGWRPSFKIYNKWLSLLTCMICVGIMFFLSWQYSLITMSVIFALYMIVMYRQPDANWGSSSQEQIYKTALSAAQRLQHMSDHIKNYHPQILVFGGNPITRPPLTDLAYLITRNTSFLMIGDIIEGKVSHRTRMELTKEAYKYFEAKKMKAFYNLVDNVDMETGIKMLIQSSGFGKLSPNIVLMGYKGDWAQCTYSQLNTYFNVLHKAFEYRVAIAILRMPNGLDYSFVQGLVPSDGIANASFEHSKNNSINQLNVKSNELMPCDSNLNIAGMTSNASSITVPQLPPLPNQNKFAKFANGDLAKDCGIPKEMVETMNYFNEKKPKGTIDVWWLYDDGGLTMLLPYIISTRSTWANCKIRIFALTNRMHELEVEERNMANLLTKLRIDYTSLIMLQGITDSPKEATIRTHAKLLDGFLEGQNSECFVSDAEREQLKEKTNRQLRLREMLHEHSKSASLIVMSLPMPRQNEVSAPMYMSWLEMLTNGMPPILLVRGNQASVLTFYS